MIFTAEGFNQFAHDLREREVVSVLHGEVKRTPHGQIISADDSSGYLHPWHCRAKWEDDAWRASVRPGLVNGEEVWADKERITRGGTVKLSRWNAGVFPPPALLETAQDRAVKSCEILLVTPRITSSQQISISGGKLDIQTTFNSTIFGAVKRYQLTSGETFQELTEPTDLDFYNGTANEPPFDVLRLVTVFAIAPSGDDGETVSSNWSLYFQYHVFWNLAHASRQDIGTNLEPLKVSFDTALAGGIGNQNPAFADFSQIESEKIRAWFAKNSSKGEFWSV